MPEKRSVVFSFDDGPGPVGALNRILTTLQTAVVKAEFYVLGNEVERFPEATRLIVKRGHRIQNHSWSHTNLAKASEADVRSELVRTQAIIKEVTGVTPTKVRPPYGAGGWPKNFDPELAKVAKSLSLSIHNWDIDTEDWKTPRGVGPAKIVAVRDQLNRKRDKSILNVLMHVQDETARDLPDFIKFMKQSGFKFALPMG